MILSALLAGASLAHGLRTYERGEFSPLALCAGIARLAPGETAGSEASGALAGFDSSGGGALVGDVAIGAFAKQLAVIGI